MVFEEKSKKANYMLYSESREFIEKRLLINSALALEFNKIIAVYNKEANNKINNSMLSNLAFECFINQLEKLSEEKALIYLKRTFEETKERDKQATLI